MEVEFDLEAYAARYSGHGLLRRVLFVGSQLASLKRDSLVLVLEALRSAPIPDLGLFQQARRELERMHRGGGGEATCAPLVDADSWLAEQSAKADQRRDMLESELQNFLSHRIRESIRMGHSDLAQFHYERGDLEAALKEYLRGIDYCTSAKQTIETCLNIASIALEQDNITLALRYCGKCEVLLRSRERQGVVASKINCVSGIALLCQQSYREAALKLLAVDASLGESFNFILSQGDVATYGVLCALASFTRDELKEKVMDNQSFRPFFEMAPRMHSIVADFCSCKYSQCLDALQGIYSELILDIYVSAHADELIGRIRNGAMIQYCSSYTAIRLSRMAACFDTDEGLLEQELTQLISSGKLKGRIDRHKQLLKADREHTPQRAYKSVLSAARTFEEGAVMAVVYAELVMHDLVVRTAEQEQSAVERRARKKGQKIRDGRVPPHESDGAEPLPEGCSSAPAKEEADECSGAMTTADEYDGADEEDVGDDAMDVE